MEKPVARFLAALICFMIISCPVLADETVFRVGVEDIRYYPQYSTNLGIYTGYGRVVLDEFAKEHGYRFEYVPLPVLRLYSRFLQAGELDFKYPDNALWQPKERKGVQVFYSDEVSEAYDGVMALPLRSRMQLRQLRTLATVRGFTATKYEHLIESGQIRLSYCDDYDSLIQMVLRGRVDGGFGCLAVARYHLEHMERSQEALTLAPDLPYTRVSYRLSTLNHPEVIEQLNEFLRVNHERLMLLRDRFGLSRRVTR